VNVQQTLEGYIKATNSHNFENVAKFVSEQAVYWFTDKEYTTLRDIEDYFNNTWDLIKDEKYSITDIHWIAIESTLATCLYRYHWEGYHNGNFISGKGNATNVFKKVNNKWKIIHEHLSPLR
jgi:ketosteroid isomerase-like protein